MLRAKTSSKNSLKRIANYNGSLHYEDKAQLIKTNREQIKQQKIGKWDKVDFFRTVRSKIKDSLWKIQNGQKSDERLIITSKGLKRRLKTVEIQLDKFPIGHTEIIKNQKHHSFYSTKKLKNKTIKPNPNRQHQQLSRLKEEKQLKLAIQNVISNKEIIQRDTKYHNDTKNHKDTKNHLLFLYQAKPKIDLVLRQKNIMKIRNLSAKKRLQTQF